MTKTEWWKLLEEDSKLLEIMADWLEDQGNPLAHTLRWAKANDRFPGSEEFTSLHLLKPVVGKCWTWRNYRHGISETQELDETLFFKLPSPNHEIKYGSFRDYVSLEEAFWALSVALETIQ